MARLPIFKLRFPLRCPFCHEDQPEGSYGFRWDMGDGDLFAVICLNCAPKKVGPDCVADGAVDSSKGNLHAKGGTNHQQGAGRRSAIPLSQLNPPGKRRRLPSGLRRAQQQRNND